MNFLVDLTVERARREGFLAERPAVVDNWIRAKEAAEYLGVPLGEIHKLTSAGQIPFAQDGPGRNCYFKRSELDDWRRNGGARAWKRNRP